MPILSKQHFTHSSQLQSIDAKGTAKEAWDAPKKTTIAFTVLGLWLRPCQAWARLANPESPSCLKPGQNITRWVALDRMG
jgi:hypothetical protein